MAKVLEKNIEAKIVAYAKKHGIKVKKKVFGDQLDRWFMIPGGKPLIMEIKAPGKKPTPLQQQEIDALWKLGYLVCWVDNVEVGCGMLHIAITEGTKILHSGMAQVNGYDR